MAIDTLLFPKMGLNIPLVSRSKIYSAMVFEGPGLAARIAHGLEDRAARDGFARVSDAVGAGA